MSVTGRLLLKRKCFNLRNGLCVMRCSSSKSGPNILTSEYSVEIPSVTIPELFYDKTKEFQKYTAIVSAETGKSYTFEELRLKSRNLSKALRKILKLQRRDTIAILLPNIPEYPICLLGALEAGLIVTTINPLYTAEEISRQLLDSSAKAIITLTNINLYQSAKSGSLLTKRQLPIVTIKLKQDDATPQGAIDFTELIEARTDIPDIEPGNTNDLAVMPYSSGTTGLPKGVELCHYNIVSNVSQLSHPDISFFIKATDTFQEIVPAVLPFFHIYGLTVIAFNTLILGGKVVTMTKFAPDLFISVLKDYDVTRIFAAPPLVLFLAAHPDVKKEYLKSVKSVSSGAAPLGVLDEQRFIEKTDGKVDIYQGYGLTETSPVVATVTKKLAATFNTSGSIGRVVPNTQVKIVAVDDTTGTPLGPNESGELLVKGPQVMKQYHNRPEETKNSFLDGWFRTGDLMHYKEDGFLYVTDRLKELIKVKGFQVAPAELEEVIRDFPSVQDAAVVGIPHPLYGEVPRAYVVPKKDNPLKIEDLKEYVANKVAKYKQLEGGVEIVDAIPKNTAGKILRRQLKLQYEAQNA